MGLIGKVDELLQDHRPILTGQLCHVFEEDGHPWKAELIKVVTKTAKDAFDELGFHKLHLIAGLDNVDEGSAAARREEGARVSLIKHEILDQLKRFTTLQAHLVPSSQ